MKLREPIVWEFSEVNDKIIAIQEEMKANASNNWSTCVFGECGAGKSTVLNIISEIYSSDNNLKLTHKF